MTRRARTTRRALATGAAAGAALALGACGGGPPADLFVVQREGSIPGASLTLRVTDDAGAYCNKMSRREITSQQLLDGRELARELNGDERRRKVGLAQRGVRLAPGPYSILSYTVRSKEGTVAFADSSPRQPLTFYKLAKLVRDIARGSCKLAR